MGNSTEIAWADSTFNPFIGCQEVSPACDNCYAREYAKRFKLAVWGPRQPRSRTSPSNWKKPLQWNAKPFYECDCGWRGDKLTEHTRACGYPEIGRIKQVRRRVFCASLADVFDNEVPAEWRRDLFDLIQRCANLDFLLLTKRIGNAKTMMADALSTCQSANRDGMIWPLQNIWLGASICNQEEADRDIPKLLAVPAAVRFISMEPLLGPVRLNLATACDRQCSEFLNAECPGYRGLCVMQAALDWVIVGGESGPKARPMHHQWVRDIRDQCVAAGVPFLFKQHGEFASAGLAGLDLDYCYENATTGGWVEFGGEFSIGEQAAPRSPVAAHVFRVGKKAAGRLLDGVLHNEFPKVAP